MEGVGAPPLPVSVATSPRDRRRSAWARVALRVCFLRVGADVCVPVWQEGVRGRELRAQAAAHARATRLLRAEYCSLHADPRVVRVRVRDRAQRCWRRAVRCGHLRSAYYRAGFLSDAEHMLQTLETEGTPWETVVHCESLVPALCVTDLPVAIANGHLHACEWALRQSETPLHLCWFWFAGAGARLVEVLGPQRDEDMSSVLFFNMLMQSVKANWTWGARFICDRIHAHQRQQRPQCSVEDRRLHAKICALAAVCADVPTSLTLAESMVHELGAGDVQFTTNDLVTAMRHCSRLRVVEWLLHRYREPAGGGQQRSTTEHDRVLLTAAGHGSVPVLELLQRAGPSWACTEAAACAAARAGNLSVVEWLRRQGVCTGSAKTAAINAAASAGRLRVLEFLHASGSDDGGFNSVPSIHALYNLETVRWFHRVAGVELPERCVDIAVGMGTLRVAEYLSHHLYPNYAPRLGTVMSAATVGNLRVVEWALPRFESVHGSLHSGVSGEDVLKVFMKAVGTSGHVACMKYAVSRCDTDARSTYFESAEAGLLLAATLANDTSTNVARYLLEQGVRPTQACIDNAAVRGPLSALEMLLPPAGDFAEYALCVSLQGLIDVCKAGRVEVLELLAARRAPHLDRPLLVAESCRNGCLPVVEFLLLHAQPPPQFGSEALLRAMYAGHLGLVELLLARGDPAALVTDHVLHFARTHRVGPILKCIELAAPHERSLLRRFRNAVGL